MRLFFLLWLAATFTASEAAAAPDAAAWGQAAQRLYGIADILQRGLTALDDSDAACRAVIEGDASQAEVARTLQATADLYFKDGRRKLQEFVPPETTSPRIAKVIANQVAFLEEGLTAGESMLAESAAVLKGALAGQPGASKALLRKRLHQRIAVLNAETHALDAQLETTSQRVPQHHLYGAMAATHRALLRTLVALGGEFEGRDGEAEAVRKDVEAEFQRQRTWIASGQEALAEIRERLASIEEPKARKFYAAMLDSYDASIKLEEEILVEVEAMIAEALDARSGGSTLSERAGVLDQRLADFQTRVDQRLQLGSDRAQLGARMK